MLKQNTNLKEVQSSLGSLISILPVSPNQWTLLSIVFALVAGMFIALNNDLVFGLAFFVIAAICDALDGAVARAKDQITPFGGFLDGVADRFVEATFLLSFMFYPLPTIYIFAPIWIAILVFMGSMPSFIRAYADHTGAITREKALALGGICERSERILILVTGLAVGLIYSMEFFVYAIILAALLSFVTCIQRIYQIKYSS